MNSQIVDLTSRLCKLRQEIECPGSTDLPRYLAASDLHGNASRLAEILVIAEREYVDQVVLVGDIYSGKGGWKMYQTLRPLVGETSDGKHRVISLWGNHELAFVAGMLGSDRQLRFFFGFGGRELINELNGALAAQGEAGIELSGSASPTAADLEAIRSSSHLQGMANWIQRTHCLFFRDPYGTGYLHACPRITRKGRLDVQYLGQQGIDALQLLERDLRTADRADHPVFSPLLQTETSPLWALFEVTSQQQFDEAMHPVGIRQLVFGHRHRTQPVNVSDLNRQIGIAVDFDQGLGGFLLIGPGGLQFRSFVETDSQRTREVQLVVPAGGLTPAETFLGEVEEFLVQQLIRTEQASFAALSVSSTRNRREFEHLEHLRLAGIPWIHRLYAELYANVNDLTVRKEMLSVVVQSCDDEAFKSFIHLLYEKTRELESLGADWYCERYLEAKAIVQAMLQSLREMPLKRLGLLDLPVRGTTSKFNLLELYISVMSLRDPDLAVMAVQNLGALNAWEADQQLGGAFFHDVRKVRICAAQELAQRGEVAYPLVAPLLSSRDNWVRFLAYWTIGQLGQRGGALRQQAIGDLHRALDREEDWLIHTTGKELLYMLGDPGAGSIKDTTEIPNLTADIVEALQGIVDSQNEPFRTAFRVYYITVALSSLVYRRGLIGLDIDELRIYVNDQDYFPPHFRYYKSGERNQDGHLRGWRRLWIRGETFNWPDGPSVIELSDGDANKPPRGRETILLYDHRSGNGTVQLPKLDAVIAEYGLGKLKDQIRHLLLQNWGSVFTDEQKSLLSRLHAAAAVKMLFDLPSEIFVTGQQARCLRALADNKIVFGETQQIRRPLVEIKRFGGQLASGVSRQSFTTRLNWIDASKYPIRVFVQGGDTF